MKPVDYNNQELKRLVALCEPDLRGYTRSGAKKLREELASPEKLEEARLALGLTRKAAAAFVGVSALTYSSWESGRTVPTVRHMAPLIWMKMQARTISDTPPKVSDAERLFDRVNHLDAEGRHYRLPSIDDIRAIRRTLGLTQSGFARLCGVSAFSARTWELGHTNPAPHALRAMIHALGDFLEK